MTQIGIEYQKMKNQREANLETARANRANEEIKWSELTEDKRHHDLQRQTSLDTANLQRQTSLDTAAINAATSRYATDQNRAASQYHTDQNVAASIYATDKGLKKGTAAGAYEAGGEGFWGGANVLGFLWDTLL